MESEEYNAIELMRQKALDIGDALSYFELCNELGLKRVDLENPRLYDSGREPEFNFNGKLEKSVTGEVEPITNARNRRVKLETYINFKNRASNIPNNDVRAMRNVLFEFFPKKFGSDGTHALSRMDDSKVIGAFYGTLRYAKRRAAEIQTS